MKTRPPRGQHMSCRTDSLASLCSPDERVSSLETRERGEIPVSGPEFGDAVVQADRRDASIVDLSAGDSALDAQSRELVEIPRALMEQMQVRGSQPSVDRFESRHRWGGRGVDPGMGDDGKKLVHGTPSNGPGFSAVGKIDETRLGRCMPLAVFTVGIDKEVRIDRDHDSFLP